MGRKTFASSAVSLTQTLLLLLDLLLLLLLLHPLAANLTLLGGGAPSGTGPKREEIVRNMVTTEKFKNNPSSRCVVINNFVFAYRQVFVEYYERARPGSS